MTAVILAAGKGRRLGPLTKNCPKPLLPVRSRPVIEHILLGIRAAGIEKAVIVVGYLGEQIVATLGSGGRIGMELAYVWQNEPRGTADAVLSVRGFVSEPFLLSWGDVLMSTKNYPALREAFAAMPAAAWIAVNQTDDPAAGAAVYFDATGRVQQIVEKPPPGTSTTHWNNAGVGIYSPSVFAYAERTPTSPRGERELTSALNAMVADGHLVYALPVVGFWSDVGTPEALAWAEQHFDDPSSCTLI